MVTPDASPADAIKAMLQLRDASRLLYVAAELAIADLLADGPRSSAELATGAGAERDALHRVLRGLAALGVFAQLDDGRFALTPVGACLRDGAADSMRLFVRWTGHPMWLQAWSSLLHTVRTGETAFDHAYGESLYAYLDDHPDHAAIFHGGAAALTAGMEAGIIAAYDVSSAGVLVDVGGGNGALLVAILRANPQASGSVLDQPHARAGAEETIEAAGLAGRCRFVAGDFFAAVPAGADAYLLKWILHNWDDARSVAILRACRRAVPPVGRLLVIEQVLAENAALSRESAMEDITMLAMLGSRERSAAEYGSLFERAGFRLGRVVPTGAGHSIVEGVPA